MVPLGFELLVPLGKFLGLPLQVSILVFQLLQLLLLFFLTLLFPLPEPGRGPCITLPLLVCHSGSLVDIDGHHDFLPVPRRNSHHRLAF
jgi:hypothetical protein